MLSNEVGSHHVMKSIYCSNTVSESRRFGAIELYNLYRSIVQCQ